MWPKFDPTTTFFAQDSDSSADLSLHLQKLFSEDQLYRIDHYLGEEAILERHYISNAILIRQGDGPEPDISALLQHDLRPHVEPGLHCQRHDHVQGAVWDARTRWILRRVWDHQGRHAEPPSSGGHPFKFLLCSKNQKQLMSYEASLSGLRQPFFYLPAFLNFKRYSAKKALHIYTQEESEVIPLECP